jgi:hypothetical protein
VQSVMAELGLLQVARSRVGGSSGIRGVSGGERRRWAGGRAGGWVDSIPGRLDVGRITHTRMTAALPCCNYLPCPHRNPCTPAT